GAHAAGKRADGTTEFQRTADVLTVPEGHPARNPWRGRDKHAVLRDRLDPPARRAEEEDVALLRFEDHLLVELADAALALLRAREHAFGDRRAREQITAVFRDDHAGRRLVDAVAGTSDPLHSARDRRRRLDLYDQIDRAHVDAELERAGRDERGETTGLEVILDAE